MYYTEEKKRELIKELRAAEAANDWDRMMDLGIELYEAYGWCGVPDSRQ